MAFRYSPEYVEVRRRQIQNATRIMCWLMDRGAPASVTEIAQGTGLAETSVWYALKSRSDLFSVAEAIGRPQGKPLLKWAAWEE